jgi:hypothetical protein
MTTGIFAWIAANAAEETLADNKKSRFTPYWRTLKTGGLLNEKFPEASLLKRNACWPKDIRLRKKASTT